MKTKKHPDEDWKRFAHDRATRLATVSKNHLLFFLVYFNHYVTYQMARFHMEFFAITHATELKMAVIESFRNSGKTTIMGFSYPIWAILGEQQKKFVLLVARTESQARQYLTNIKSELESNKLLRSDLGPFEEPNDEWRSSSVVLPRYDARITAVSIEQSIRGLKHGPYRPDLILCDDLEDLASIKTRESRDRLYNWLVGDILPMGDTNTKFIVIGTRLHEDSLIMRLKRKIEDEEMSGQSFHYPLVDRDGKIAWLAKFPTMRRIEEEQKKIGNNIAWRREYLLEIVPEDTQVINQEWIQYYDELPKGPPRYALTAVDPALSQKDSADCTAILSAKVYGSGDDLRIYILPNPINKKNMFFSEMLEHMRNASRTLGGGGMLSKVLIEDVGIQSIGQIQLLKAEGFPIQGYKPGMADKRARLMSVSPTVQDGKVLFHRKTCETLIQQIVFLGVERYDDLADAFSMLIGQIMVDESQPKPGITWITVGGPTRQLSGAKWWDDDECDSEISSSFLWGRS